MCVKFINLNKACFKDNFTQLKIDRLMNSTTRFEYMSSLDANSGYHHIHMHIMMKIR